MPTYAESVVLLGDETLTEYLNDLEDAIGAAFDLDAWYWFVADVLEDGAVICVCDDGEREYFKLPYERDEGTGEFQFGEPAEVEAHITYPPADGPEEDAEDDTILEAVDNPTKSQRQNLPDAAFAALVPQGNARQPRRILPHHVNTVKDASDNKTVDLPRLRNSLARFNQLRDVPHSILVKAANHLEKHAKALKVGQHATIEAAELDRLLAGMREHIALVAKDTTTTGAVPAIAKGGKLVRRAIPKAAGDVSANGVGTVREYTKADPLKDTWLCESFGPATSKRTTAPNGKEFLATFRGQAGRTNRINRNGRLYVGANLSENVSRIAGQIGRAYANGAAASNHDIVVGHANHPDAFLDYMSMASIMIECREGTGGCVDIEKGILDMPGGRILMEARSYGIPLGESWVASGRSTKKKMDRQNPYFLGNEEFEGQTYDEITDWTVHLSDTVPDPSALVWLGEHADVPNDLREQVVALCADGSKPVDGKCACRAATAQPPITEAKEPAITQTETIVDDKTSNTKADGDKVAEATIAKFAEFEAKLAETVKANDAKLAEQAASYEKKLAEQAVEINKLSEAAAKAVSEAALLKKLDEVTKGKPANEAKRNHVQMLSDLGVKVTAENVEELVSKWEAVNAPLLKILEGKDGTAPDRSNEEKALADSKEATAPKTGTSLSNDPLGLYGFSLTDSPKTEGAAA